MHLAKRVNHSAALCEVYETPETRSLTHAGPGYMTVPCEVFVIFEALVQSVETYEQSGYFLLKLCYNTRRIFDVNTPVVHLGRISPPCTTQCHTSA